MQSARIKPDPQFGSAKHVANENVEVERLINGQEEAGK
jgi:hypothetical protein